MTLVVYVDGWLHRVEGDPAFIEFRSGDGQAGGFKALDTDGNQLTDVSLGKPLPDAPWHRRVPEMTLAEQNAAKAAAFREERTGIVDLRALGERP